MQKLICAITVLAALSGCATTTTGAKPVNQNLKVSQGAKPIQDKDIPIVDYKYGMHLDVAKVISMTDISKDEGLVPVTMKYADSQGNIHKVRVIEYADDTLPQHER